MQEERDHLRDHVFPVLEERLRERRHHFEPIDLRWGVETASVDRAHARELLVLKVCLEEINRSRPFLIGLVGDRYGWVPPPERMEAATREAGYQTSVEGKSITALEIEYGVLNDPDQQRRTFFYFRDPLPYDEMPPEIAKHYSDAHDPAPTARDAVGRLEALKERIRREMPDRVRSYHADWDGEQQTVTRLEAWGRQVLEDLWRELDEATREYARQPIPSWQDQERWSLEQFVENRGRGFVGRQDVTGRVCDLAISPVEEVPPWGFCITGESGSGKSALFAHLYRVLQGQQGILLLAHAAGISPRSGQVDAMLRRWTQELADSLGVADPLDDSSSGEEIEERFREFLSRVSVGRRVVVLIDALNQFEPTPRARHVTWLPKLFPQNARLIVTTIPGTESEALGRRGGVEGLPLALLNADEAEHIATAVCRRYHRTLNPEVLHVLLEKRLPDGRLAAGIPLWLELALEELNLLDADDFARADREYPGGAAERLQQMMVDVARELPADVAGLYGHMLTRSEALFGMAWARGFANLIAVSRQGWRESDLRVLLPQVAQSLAPQGPREEWSNLRFAALRRTYRAHLVQRGAQAQWDFFHAQMRLAIDRRSLTDPGSVRELHTQIADHLESLPPEDPLRQTELMFHLIGADDRLRAARYYAGVESDTPELAGATRALADHILTGMTVKREDLVEPREANPGLSWVLSLLDQPGLEAAERGALCNNDQFDLLETLENDAGLDTRLVLIRRTHEVLQRLAEQDPTNASWQRDLSVSHNKVGDVLRSQGDAAGALSAYRDSLAIAERLAEQDPTNASWQRDVSVSCYKIADLLERMGDAQAPTWWRRAYDTLSGMKHAGLHISPDDERVLEWLRQKVE